jgi:hypothetical protein
MPGPLPLTVESAPARDAFDASVTGFVEAVEAVGEWDLLGFSRCHGWTRLEVVTHVLAGWQEMLGGMVSPVADEPTVDAASYWRAFAEEYGGEDPVLVLTAQRRRATAYARPSSALEQLRDVAAAVRRGAASLDPAGRYLWQGHVFTTGDFLATWAVEDVVHQLDLDLPGAPHSDALGLARATVEAIAGGALPQEWDDIRAVLVGTGRQPVPEGLGQLAERLPAFS